MNHDAANNTDLELAGKLMEGDEAAFTALVSKYADSLHYFIYRICGQRQLTEEVVQEVFTQLWVTRESLEPVRHFRNYLYTIARNHALFLLKRIDREKTLLQEWQTAAAANNQEFDPEHEYHLTLVEQAITQLTPHQQKVWELSRKQGKKYTEIAEELNISRETVKKHLQHASAFVKEYVKGRLLAAVALAAANYFLK